MKFVLAALSAIVFLASFAQAQDKVFYCYFESWATYRNGDCSFEPEQVDPFLCTHLSFAFAGVDDSTHEIKILDPYYESCGAWNLCAYGRFTNLKRYNPNLKTLLSVGGWNEGATKYMNMAATSESRKAFIDSALNLVLLYNFNGIDMDWEYPGGRDDSPGDPVNDPANYVLLLQEMRAAFDQAEADGRTGDLGRLIMTAAVSAGWQTIDQAYIIPDVAASLDYVNVMAYDFHGWFDGTIPYTGHHAPMYPLPEEEDPSHEFYGWNVDYAINYWIDGGAPREKLLLGIPTYGRGFTLADANNNGFYELATGPNPAGTCTNEPGFAGYHEFCEDLPSSTIVTDDNVMSPYAYQSVDWMGYDDPESAGYKAQYAVDMGLGGAFVWSLDTDDFQNWCGYGENPIMTTIVNVLNGGPMTTPPGYTVPATESTTTYNNGGNTPPPDEMCDGTYTIHVDPNGDCSKYYYCTVGADGEWVITWGECPEDLVFIEDIQACDWPENHPDDPCVSGQMTTTPQSSEQTTTEKPATTQDNGGGDTTTESSGTTGSGSECAPNPEEVCPSNPTMLYDNSCDCTHYYQCQQEAGSEDWTFVEEVCAPGTAFNPEIHICDYPANVPGCEDAGF